MVIDLPKRRMLEQSHQRARSFDHSKSRTGYIADGQVISGPHPDGNETHVSNKLPRELGHLSHNFRDIIGDLVTLCTYPKHGQQTCVLHCNCCCLSFHFVNPMSIFHIPPYEASLLPMPWSSPRGGAAIFPQYSQTKAEMTTIRVGPIRVSSSVTETPNAVTQDMRDSISTGEVSDN